MSLDLKYHLELFRKQKNDLEIEDNELTPFMYWMLLQRLIDLENAIGFLRDKIDKIPKYEG